MTAFVAVPKSVCINTCASIATLLFLNGYHLALLFFLPIPRTGLQTHRFITFYQKAIISNDGFRTRGKLQGLSAFHTHIVHE